MRFPHGPGFGMFGGILEDVIAGLFFIVCFLIVVGLLVVIVRFLLVATKAAEIYVAKNGTAAPVETTTPVAPTTTVGTAPSTTAPVATTPLSTTPRPRTRTTKPPTP